MSCYSLIPANMSPGIFLTRWHAQTCYFRLWFSDHEFPQGGLIPHPENPDNFDWEMPDHLYDGGQPDTRILIGDYHLRPRPQPWSLGVDAAFVRYPPTAQAALALRNEPANQRFIILIEQQGQADDWNSQVKIAW